MITTMSQIDQLKEIIRGYILTWLNKDLPYKVWQKTVSWQTDENGKIIIEHELAVPTIGMAKCVCGKDHKLMKHLNEKVKMRLSKLWASEIDLFIFVRVDEKARQMSSLQLE